MISFFLASLFFTTPAPLDMPTAEGWVVRQNERLRIEDRFEVDELWYSRTVIGSWQESEGLRGFLWVELKYLPPSVDGRVTRTDYETTLVRPNKREDKDLFRQLVRLSPVALSGDYARPRQLPRGMKDVRYYEGTNVGHIVCAYLPERTDHWSAAIWELAPDDDCEEMRKRFEDEFWKELGSRRQGQEAGVKGKAKLSERELLKRDAAHSVFAYDSWHCTPGEDFVILDDLSSDRGFINALTNALPVWRRDFAAALPTSVDTSDTLSVARIYHSRADFLLAAGENLGWAAAYWNPRRRELVACLPPSGDLVELTRTFRHEAFHQYLTYAAAMIPVSPWLNEGYAQYFEDEGRDTFDLTFTEEQWDEAELALPGLMMMDYPSFYAGLDVDRRTHYRLAWSVAYFIEHGLRDIRFDPFAKLKNDYFSALFRTRDMHAATEAAFGSEERLKLFCNEWKKFWKNRH